MPSLYPRVPDSLSIRSLMGVLEFLSQITKGIKIVNARPPNSPSLLHRMMNHPNYYSTMAQYNQWMNEKLYATCATIPEEKRQENLGAFFQSIHKTLNHILYGDRIWMARFQGKSFSAPNVGIEMYADFDELRGERESCDREMIDWTQTFTPEWLEQPLTYTSKIDNVTRVLPTGLLVTHLFNHQTHHRGQVTTLLSQLGYDIGPTDLPWLPSLNCQLN